MGVRQLVRGDEKFWRWVVVMLLHAHMMLAETVSGVWCVSWHSQLNLEWGMEPGALGRS